MKRRLDDLWFWVTTPYYAVRRYYRGAKDWVTVRNFGRYPHVGQLVCDCRYVHQRIVSVTSGDDLVLEDGHTCSYRSCCNLVPHPEWEHPEF